MAADWYYKIPGQEEAGPVTLETLRSMCAAGELKKSNLVRENQGAWRTAQSVEPIWSVLDAENPAETPPATEASPPAATTEPAPAPTPTPTSSNDVEPADTMTVVDAHDYTTGPRPSAPTPVEYAEPESLDDLGIRIVDTTETPKVESLDDLGITIVDGDGASSASGRSRVLTEDEWTDPDAFDVQHVEREKKSAPDPTDLSPELRELADNALVGSTTTPKSKPATSSKKSKKSSSPPQNAATASPPTVGWFVRIEGRPHGPIEFDALKSWVAEGRVLEEDEIQLPGTGVWVPAGSVPTLFEGVGLGTSSAPTAAPAPAAPPAEPPVAEAPPTPAPVTPEPAPQPAAPEPPTGIPSPAPAAAPAAFTPPAAPAAPAAWAPPAQAGAKPKKAKVGRAPSQLGQQISEFFSSFGGGGGGSSKSSPAALVALGVIVLILAYWFFPSFDNDGAEHAKLMEIYQRSVTLREKNDSSAWGSFVSEAQPVVQAMADSLETTASAKEPEKQRMLWASRDYLLPILSGDAGTDVETENDEKFKTHMASALEYIEGRVQEESDEGEGDGESGGEGEGEGEA